MRVLDELLLNANRHVNAVPFTVSMVAEPDFQGTSWAFTLRRHRWRRCRSLIVRIVAALFILAALLLASLLLAAILLTAPLLAL